MAKEIISHAQLVQILRYNPETGIFVWLPRTKDMFPQSECRRKTWNTRNSGKSAGHRDYSGYVGIPIMGKRYLAHRLAWFYMYKEWPFPQIDHINRNNGDNRLSNLRIVTASQNQHNKIHKPNMAGACGVYKTRYGKFRALIKINNKSINLGTHDCLESAKLARRNAEILYLSHA